MHTTHGCSVCVENSYIVVENSKSIFWSYAVLVKGKAIDKLQSPACGYFLFLDLVSCWENFYAMGFSHHSVKPVFNSKLFYYHWIFNSHTQLLCGGGLTFYKSRHFREIDHGGGGGPSKSKVNNLRMHKKSHFTLRFFQKSITIQNTTAIFVVMHKSCWIL